MDLNLSGKSALVCGASKGIGRACARAIAELGASVTVVSRSPEGLDEVIEDLNKINPDSNHESWVLDFDDIPRLEKELENRSHLNYEILINNSGGPPAGPLTEASKEDLLAAFNRHVIASHLITGAVKSHMEEKGYGRIVNIISTSVKQPIPGLGVSNTIRGAMGNWAKTMAGELGPHGITVNNLLPGRTQTGRLNSLMKHWAETRGITLEDYQGADLVNIPLRRYGQPQEIGDVVAFLCSPAAGYISGTNIVVDGGRTKSL
ncbi:MAG: SDR family oxidoreductase [Saprospiraceae bacterium]|nr:SDR family oxidoreductase [Saprospiraceae bacterium]